MKIIFKFSIYFVFFIFCILYFLPKESLYFKFEEYLKTKEVIISDEKIKEIFFGIRLENGKLFFNKINRAKIESIDLQTYLFFTKIIINNIVLDKSLSIYTPLKIDEIIIKNSILKFNKIHIKGIGEFGILNGEIDYINRILKIVLEPSTEMKTKMFILNQMQKGENEKYTYEYKF